MAWTFTYKGRKYKMVPWRRDSDIHERCETVGCPFEDICPSFELQEVKGPCSECHPVEITTIRLTVPETFRNASEEQDWRDVLTMAKSWGWIQD